VDRLNLSFWMPSEVSEITGGGTGAISRGIKGEKRSNISSESDSTIP